MSFVEKPIRRFAYVLGRAVRETGQALDRVGCRLQGNYSFVEQLSRHRRIMNLYDKIPKIGKKTFIAPSASVIGEVEVGEGTSIWYGAVLRGDVNFIKIGENTSIGDNVVIHVARTGLKKENLPTLIGDNVVIAQGAIIHACTIEDSSLVDMGATVLDGAVVSHNSILGPGSLLMEGQRVPPGELWAGSPAKFVRKLSAEETKSISDISQNYRSLANIHEEYHQEDEVNREEDRLKRYRSDWNTEPRPEKTF